MLEHIQLICENCGKEFSRYKKEVEYYERKNPNKKWYCCRKCAKAFTSKHMHHINGNKRDNRPENLEIFESQAEHARVHMLERYCNA